MAARARRQETWWEPEPEVSARQPSAAGAILQAGSLPAAVVLWEEGGVAGRRRRVAGVWERISAKDAERAARRRWAWAGGWKAVAKEAAAAAALRRRRVLADVLRWSGGAVPVPGESAAAAFAEVRERAAEALRARLPAVQRRAIGGAMMRTGMACDGRGRWAVEQVLEWRGSGAQREAKVKWAGVWEAGWVKRSLLTADLRAEGRTKRAVSGRAKAAGRSAAEAAAELEARAAAGRRVSPRLAEVARWRTDGSDASAAVAGGAAAGGGPEAVGAAQEG